MITVTAPADRNNIVHPNYNAHADPLHTLAPDMITALIRQRHDHIIDEARLAAVDFSVTG